MAKKSAGTRTLEILLEQSGENLAIQWYEPDVEKPPWDEYFVPIRRVHQCASEIRRCLADLEQLDWETADVVAGPRLQALAKAGADLYQVLLSGNPNDTSSQKTAQAFRNWFEETVLESDDDWRIQVVHQQYDDQVIPWGLIFSPLAQGSIDGLTDTFEDYQNFWCHSFNLACRGVMRQDAEKIKPQLEDVDSEVAITIEADEHVFKYHRERKPGVTDIRDFTAIELSEFEEKPDDLKRFNLFWYYWLRANGDGLNLNGEILSDSEISQATDDVNKIIVHVLDGDSIISRENGARWLEAALKEGRSGLIAAETDITNPQLTHFGWFFTMKIMRGEKPLIEAIHDARGDPELWPRSLLYGIYCDPLHIYFVPPPNSAIDRADDFLTSVREILAKNAHR